MRVVGNVCPSIGRAGWSMERLVALAAAATSLWLGCGRSGAMPDAGPVGTDLQGGLDAPVGSDGAVVPGQDLAAGTDPTSADVPSTVTADASGGADVDPAADAVVGHDGGS